MLDFPNKSFFSPYIFHPIFLYFCFIFWEISSTLFPNLSIILGFCYYILVFLELLCYLKWSLFCSILIWGAIIIISLLFLQGQQNILKIFCFIIFPCFFFFCKFLFSCFILEIFHNRLVVLGLLFILSGALKFTGALFSQMAHGRTQAFYYVWGDPYCQYLWEFFLLVYFFLPFLPLGILTWMY